MTTPRTPLPLSAPPRPDECGHEIADKVLAALHEAWLAVHVHRFDKQDGSTGKPDSFYAGVIHSEHQITEVAARFGIDATRLRNPSISKEGVTR